MNTALTPRRYGHTDIFIHPLGLGAAQVGDPALDDADVGRMLNAAIDAGVTLFDTAPSYGISEDRLGRHIAHRRKEVVMSTKLGYGVPGVPDWTGECITLGVDQALRLLRTDYIDIAHFHSCPRSVLERGDVIDALEAAKRAGKVRALAYSGENEDLAYAVACGRFDGFMASLNICDQRILGAQLPVMQGKGFIAKRAVANHPWRFAQRPVGDYCEEYWVRWQAMGLDPRGLEWGEISLRFALGSPGVHAAVVGTAKQGHLMHSLEWAAKGPLEADWMAELQQAFTQYDQGWTGQI
ncbi:MAG: aldo/keto reductase [Burkholderiales bacterium PBB4]|nr:MAG: aldo/keto reductase [Burkholderiales bacterium PBB4]